MKTRSSRRILAALLAALMFTTAVVLATPAGSQPDQDPFGSLDAAIPGIDSLRLRGWTADPSEPTTSLRVHVYNVTTGAFAGSTDASYQRGDVANAFPGYGAAHGFDITVGAPQGTHTFCAYAVNVGAGTSNPAIGCSEVTIDRNPKGSLDSTAVSPGQVRVRGSASDPDWDGAISVHVWDTLNGVYLGSGHANAGNDYYDMAFNIGPGQHTICTYGINVGQGDSNTELGCRAFSGGGDPVGSFNVAETGFLRWDIWGYALDVDTTSKTTIHLWDTLNGVYLGSQAAGAATNDVPGSYRDHYGSNRGWSHTIQLPTGGRANVCAFAINKGTGSNTELGCHYASDGPVVYLTFDDGPSGYTPAVLDALRAYGAKATFFVLGAQVSANPGLAQRIANEGHDVENHSWSHPALTGLSNDGIAGQLGATTDIIGQVTGQSARCMRPPYGATDGRVASIAANQGLTQILWNVDPSDFQTPGAGAIAARVLGSVFDGAVVLLHDGGGNRSQTAAALYTIIPELQARGYRLEALCP
jgi:peptidoglycan/xylan/chitin deacetylase (PgdA/CDA1 family)